MTFTHAVTAHRCRQFHILIALHDTLFGTCLLSSLSLMLQIFQKSFQLFIAFSFQCTAALTQNSVSSLFIFHKGHKLWHSLPIAFFASNLCHFRSKISNLFHDQSSNACHSDSLNTQAINLVHASFGPQ